MLRRLKPLIGDAVAATDGEAGRLEQVYFDDEHWRLRYLVVNTGGGLTGRKVLVPPEAVDRGRWSDDAVGVRLTREEVADSTSADEDMPVSRRFEEASAPELSEEEREASRARLRASGEVLGYSVFAPDGKLGHLDDLLFDDGEWTIAGLIVEGGAPIPVSAVDGIDWRTREIRVRLRREELRR
ncbi:MAG TPA: PRC-barrel domain-containing protein [Burkholderiales bacterium]|nr:PRC-barrel domain-containing protein [Burkholderiales bacterium]